MEDGRLRVKKFNDQNYQLWKMQMENYLYQKYMYLSLRKYSEKVMSMTNTKCEILDRNVVGTIKLWQRQWHSTFQRKEQQKV